MRCGVAGAGTRGELRPRRRRKALGAEHSRRWRDGECAAWPSSGYRPPMPAGRVSISGARPNRLPHPSARARSRRPLQWQDLAEGRLRLERLCHNGWTRLSSPVGAHPARCAGPRIAVIPREATKSRPRRPPLCCGRNPHPIAPARRGPRGDVASLAFGPRSPSRPQWCGLRRQDGDGTWPPSAPSRRPAPTS